MACRKGAKKRRWRSDKGTSNREEVQPRPAEKNKEERERERQENKKRRKLSGEAKREKGKKEDGQCRKTKRGGDDRLVSYSIIIDQKPFPPT